MIKSFKIMHSQQKRKIILQQETYLKRLKNVIVKNMAVTGISRQASSLKRNLLHGMLMAMIIQCIQKTSGRKCKTT